MTHKCISKLTIIGSDNGLSPGRRQAIIWTNAGILLIWPLGTNVSEISIDIQTFSLKKIHFKMSSGKWRQFCLGLNVLKLFDQMTLSKLAKDISENTQHVFFRKFNDPKILKHWMEVIYRVCSSFLFFYGLWPILFIWIKAWMNNLTT